MTDVDWIRIMIEGGPVLLLAVMIWLNARSNGKEHSRQYRELCDKVNETIGRDNEVHMSYVRAQERLTNEIRAFISLTRDLISELAKHNGKDTRPSK